MLSEILTNMLRSFYTDFSEVLNAFIAEGTIIVRIVTISFTKASKGCPQKTLSVLRF